MSHDGGGAGDRAAPARMDNRMSASSAEPVHVRFVRHGEVAERHKGTFYGGAEADLSEAGHAASLALAERLAQDPPHLIVASPLTRARMLAEELARHCGLQAEIDPAWTELDRGDWTHLRRAEIEDKTPGAIDRYLADPEAGAAPGGERESDLCHRVWPALDALAVRAPGKRAVVVAHGHVIRVVMRRLCGWGAVESLSRFVPYHAVVSARLWVDGRGELIDSPATDMPEALRRRP